jgi:hypothetical protein
MGPPALLPLRKKSCYGFLSSLKIHRPRRGGGLNLGCNGKHVNHWATEGDYTQFTTVWKLVALYTVLSKALAEDWINLETSICLIYFMNCISQIKIWEHISLIHNSVIKALYLRNSISLVWEMLCFMQRFFQEYNGECAHIYSSPLSSSFYPRFVREYESEIQNTRRTFRTSSPWWWRQYAPLKRRSTSIWPHGSTSQKTKLRYSLAKFMSNLFIWFYPGGVGGGRELHETLKGGRKL